MKSNRSPDFYWPMKLHSLFLKLTGSLHKRIFCSCIQTWISWWRCSGFGGKCVIATDHSAVWMIKDGAYEFESRYNHPYIMYKGMLKQLYSIHILSLTSICISETYGTIRNYYTEAYGTAIRNHTEIFSTNFSHTEKNIRKCPIYHTEFRMKNFRILPYIYTEFSRNILAGKAEQYETL